MEGPAMELSCPVCGKMNLVSMAIAHYEGPVKMFFDFAKDFGVKTYAFEGKAICSCGSPINATLTVNNVPDKKGRL
ncbi:hypothetical protein FACS1894106_2810 [Spirochaetia bacterium]|nr:hypothetical protein FACS1894106_2810 [Spirochaetia bacterium]